MENDWVSSFYFCNYPFTVNTNIWSFLLRNYRTCMKLQLKLFIFKVAIHAVEHAEPWKIYLMFNFANWSTSRFQNSFRFIIMLNLCYFTPVQTYVYFLIKWNHPHHEKKIFISIFGIEVSIPLQMGFFFKLRKPHWEIEILILLC